MNPTVGGVDPNALLRWFGVECYLDADIIDESIFEGLSFQVNAVCWLPWVSFEIDSAFTLWLAISLES